MFIRDLKDCPEFVAGDKSLLRELLHPDKADLEINYSLAQSTVKKGEASLPHKLAASEVYYILEGRGIMHISDERAEVIPHQAIYIPRGAVQYIENTGRADLKFLCIVDPAWQPGNEEII